MTTQEKVENWFVPLSTEELTLKQAHSQLDEFGLDQEDIPLIIQLVENPKFDLPGIDIFHGATNLETHDYIHILLGRGVMIKDEAFVLGFTMGSSNRVTTTEERLFGFLTKHIFIFSFFVSLDICFEDLLGTSLANRQTVHFYV